MNHELELIENKDLKAISPKKHIIMSQQFSKDYIDEVFLIANFMKKNKRGVSDILKGNVVAMLFYEPSTRTRFSFESAVYRLGGNPITTENAKEFSSASKGETLEDTIRMVGNYADIAVMRHYEDDSSDRAVRVSKIPIINAGSGKSQHPTQALLDIYTIYENYKSLENLNVAVVGDLLRGRTCDSLVYLLSKYRNNTFYFVSPDNSKIKYSLRDHLMENNIRFIETTSLEDVLPKLDVCYMTRVQKERFSDEKEYEQVKGKYILGKNNVELMKKSAIIMHPLPRVDELSFEIDDNSRAKYFQQAENGLYVRMALLKILAENN